MTTAATTSWAQHAGSALDRSGQRRGRARSAVVEMLAGESCALTATEIEERLQAAQRPVSRASIYRVLEQLAALGLVNRLELGRGHARYEVADPRGEHHHHLLCDRCGALTPFGDTALERSIAGVSRRVGDFHVRGHEVVLHGTCGRCAG